MPGHRFKIMSYRRNWTPARGPGRQFLLASFARKLRLCGTGFGRHLTAQGAVGEFEKNFPNQHLMLQVEAQTINPFAPAAMSIGKLLRLRLRALLVPGCYKDGMVEQILQHKQSEKTNQSRDERCGNPTGAD